MRTRGRSRGRHASTSRDRGRSTRPPDVVSEVTYIAAMAVVFGLVDRFVLREPDWKSWTATSVILIVSGGVVDRVRRWHRTRRARKVNDQADQSGGLADRVGQVNSAEG